MDPREHDRLARFEQWYWWHRGRLAIVRRVLGRYAPPGARLLDVGCGTGATTRALAAAGGAVGMDVGDHALRHARGLGLAVVRASAARLPVRPGTFDVAIALDVLEHLDDDVGAAREILGALRPGGLLVATVPAYPFLWSAHDEALGHRRRYRRAPLRRVLEGAGFECVLCCYVMGSILPAAMAVRLWERWVRRGPAARESGYVVLPAPINAALAALTCAGSRLLPWLRLPFGLSLLAVARRPDARPAPAPGARRAAQAGARYARPLAREVAPADPPQVDARAQVVGGADLRACDVGPLHQRQLADHRVGRRKPALAPRTDHAREDLDVEGPARDEGLGEELAQRRARAKELGAALRVVDAQPEHRRDRGRGQPAEVVAQRVPLDPAAEQHDPRAHHELEPGARCEHAAKLDHRLERRREIGVPEARVRDLALERAEHAAAHRLGLARVLGQREHAHAPRPGALERAQPRERRIARAVVDEDEIDRGLGREEGLEARRGQAVRLVVTRNHDGGALRAGGRVPIRFRGGHRRLR